MQEMCIRIEIYNNGETIKSFYSINANSKNRPVLWIGEFKNLIYKIILFFYYTTSNFLLYYYNYIIN